MRATLVAAVLVCICLEAQANRFGSNGRNGSNGIDGKNGRSGPSVTIYADGSPLEYYLDGHNATAGQPAWDGDHAYSCHQPTRRFHVYGANGGNGGDGGDGGRGGNGGSALIYYDNIDDLKSIYISSTGGRGAPGAQGGYAGEGCHCRVYSWIVRLCRTQLKCSTVKRCEKKEIKKPNGEVEIRRVCRDVKQCHPVQVCHNQHYTCRDGSRGRDGRHGYHGSNGSMGAIQLVKNIKSLPAEHTHLKNSVSQLVHSTHVLSKRIWESKKGAKSLLHPQSQVRDAYHEYVELAQKKVRIIWDSHRDVEEFKDSIVSLEFDGNRVYHNVISSDFLKVKVESSTDEFLLVITDAYKRDEFNQLENIGPQSYGDNMTITIKDRAAMSLIVKNKVFLKLRNKRIIGWKTNYEDYVPQEAMTITEDQIVIHLGKLDVRRKGIKRKNKIKYSISINRSFEGKSIDVHLKQSKIQLK